MDLFFVPPDSTLASEGNRDQIQRASDALPQIGDALAQPMKQFWENMSAVGAPPSTIELSLSLLFEGKAGWAIISARAQSSLNLKLTWEKPNEGGENV